MQPTIHQTGNKKAVEIAELAKLSGLTTKFNDDPQVSVDTFPFHNQFTWINPTTKETDETAFAFLIRECVHYEVETYANFLTMGFDVTRIFPSLVLSYMKKSCRAVFESKLKGVNIAESEVEKFARVLVHEVYLYIQKDVNLVSLDWSNASPNML